MRRRELLGTVTGMMAVPAADERPAPRTGVELLGSLRRILVEYEKSTALVRSTWHHRLGLNPPLQDDEVRALSAAQLNSFSIGVRVTADDLRIILQKTRPHGLLLGHASDDTCAVLAEHQSLRGIEVMGGGISRFGLQLLLALKLERLSIGSHSLSSEQVARVMQKKWNTPHDAVEIRTLRYQSKMAWPVPAEQPDSSDRDD